MFIDPHGMDIVDILSLVPKERYEDVIYFDPGDAIAPDGFEYARVRHEVSGTENLRR